MKTNVIHIEITAPVSAGKTTVMASINKLLVEHGYCVAIPKRGDRGDMKTTLDDGKSHQMPPRDSTVIILSEHCQSAGELK